MKSRKSISTFARFCFFFCLFFLFDHFVFTPLPLFELLFRLISIYGTVSLLSILGIPPMVGTSSVVESGE